MARRAQKNVGVIGLGIIGQRVAENLRRGGFQVYVWNRTPRPFPNFVGSPAELAAVCDFVQIFVSDDEALLQMVRQMTRELGAHHVVMAHSTVAPDSMRSAAEIVQRRGAEFLDAPFTGSKLGAEKGELIYYVGGDEMALRRARPVLEASSKEIVEIGAIGQATAVKVATNIVTAATVQAAVEALALAHGAGISPEQFSRALRSNATHSGTLGFKLPNIIKGDFAPHFSVKNMLKDVRIAARMAHSSGIDLPANEAARDCLEEELRQGRGDADYSSVARQYFSGDLENLETHDAHPAAEQLELAERPCNDSANPQPAAEPAKPKVALDTRGDFTLSPDPDVGGQPLAPIALAPPASADAETENAPTFPQMNGSDAVVPEPDARAETPPATETRPPAENAPSGEAMLTAENAPSREAPPAAEPMAAREHPPAAEVAAEAKDAGPNPDETPRRGFFERFFRHGGDS